MHAPYGSRSYLEVQVRSASPIDLVVLLYDGALQSAAAASAAMGQHDIPARRRALNKLFGFLGELQSSLDYEKGGAVAAELARLYDYMVTRLTDAIVRQDAAPIDEVRRLLEPLRDAWRQAATSTEPAGAPR
jgi:flagellar protein FliS